MHLTLASALLRVMHLAQSHSPGLGLNISASDGNAEEAVAGAASFAAAAAHALSTHASCPTCRSRAPARLVASISSATAASCLFSHASIRAVLPFLSVRVASAPRASSFATVPDGANQPSRRLMPQQVPPTLSLVREPGGTNCIAPRA